MSDPVVVACRTLVRPADDDRIVHPITTVSRRNLFDQILARHLPNVRKPLDPQHRETRRLRLPQPIANPRGVKQDARVYILPHHLRQRHLMHLHPVRPESLRTECWALSQHHRWQLRRVARQNQPTPLALVDVFNQIVQQMATPEGVLPRTFVRDHRRLIDDEERILL